MSGETVKRAVGRNHTVAGDLRCEGVDAECAANGLRGSASDLPCDPAIGRDLSAWNTRGHLVDLHLKGGGLRTGFHVGYFITRRSGGVKEPEFDFRCISNRHGEGESA